LLAWLAGLLVSALMAWWAHGANQRLYAERLADISDEVADSISQRFGLYEYGLRGARGAVVAAGGTSVSREVFAAYMATRDLAREFPGARGFGFIRRVPRAEEQSFLAQARAEGPASFAIRELGQSNGERFVIQYIYPLDQNQGATGLDVASEAHRREAALTAAREGRAQITAPVSLVQADAQPRRGFLVYLPVYRAGAPVHTPEARDAATIGWAYAPLVVDDVLAEWRAGNRQVAISLTDLAETEPFFDSMPTGVQPLAGVPAMAREITVHGRRWRMEALALPALAVQARPMPVAVVWGSAVVVTTLLALLLWVLLKRREERNGHGDADAPHQAAAPVTLQRFVRSPQLRWAALAYLGFLAAYLWLVHEAEWTRELNEARHKLTSLVDERVTRLREAQQARRKALLFLADVPPVQGLVRSQATGIDPLDGSRRETWELRMKQILTAHMNASPEVYRARLVAAADNGRELVRVERREPAVVAVPADGLKTLGEDPDLRQALSLQAGEVWMSELDLHQEEGQLERPYRPTIRYTTPVYRVDGQPFGAILVNVDVAERKFESAALTPPGGALYILNAAGDFLLHPDPARRYGTTLGHGHRWEDEFHAAAKPDQLSADDRLQVLRGEKGLVVAATAAVSPNPASAEGTIRYTAVLPLAQVQAHVWAGLGRSLYLPLAAGVAGTLLLFFHWASVQRQLQVQSQRMRLATIVDQSMDAIVGLDGTHSVTSWNRGAQLLFGIQEQQAIGRGLFELIGTELPAVPPSDAAAWAQARVVQELDCRDSQGRHLRVAMTWSPLDGGQTGESSVVLRDVTEERAAQNRIVDLNRGLAQQVQERTEMLDILAHEVRQPLHNASAAMEGARFALDSDGRDESSGLVFRAQAVLAEVQRRLDNTLAVASLLARPDPIHLEDADVDTLIGVAIADMPAAERGRIQVQRETTTRTVLMDVSLMRLALRNLLSNALKFSPPGAQVRVRIADSDEPLGLLIDVSDSGPGVSPDIQPRLFLRGARGSGRGAGHGLGLYIVHQVMKLHQGSIELIHSGPGGATFRMTIVQEALNG
jgi:PAS domain S-box-containing protein